MSTNDVDVDENTESTNSGPSKHHPYFHTARKILLASVGAMSLAQDEIEDFVNRLIQRGEIAESDGRKLMEEIRDRRKANMGKAEDLMTKRLESMFKRMNTPTKAEMDSLSEKIASLSNKLDEIIAQQSK